EGKSVGLNDALWLWKVHAQSLEAKVTANKPESAAGIVVLHVKHAVQADRRVGVKARQQAPLAFMPQVIAQSMSAVFRAHDEEPHEAVLFSVSDNRASAYQLTVCFSCNETLRVGSPNTLASSKPGFHPSRAAQSTRMSSSSRVIWRTFMS